MIKIKISNSEPCVNFTRQTPNGSAIWGNCKFFFNEEIDDCDYWVIYDSINKKEMVQCYPDNTIFFTGEPPSIKKYSKFFLSQFYTVFSCREDLKHNNIIKSHPALPWLAGISFNFNTKQWDNANAMTMDAFEKEEVIDKTKLISIITSNKTLTLGHKNRVRFLEQICHEFPNQIDIFGAGFSPIQDKYDGLARYKYSIVIENSSYEDYWTEKLADCFLTETYPIYYGCPNIHDYFPHGSLTIINIENVEEAIATIKSVIKSNEYEKSIELIRKSKNLLLNKYNFFPIIVDFINIQEKNKILPKKKKKIKVYPEKRFQKMLKIIIKRIIAFWRE